MECASVLMHRRKFIEVLGASLVPPIPKVRPLLESPKGAEQRRSFRRSRCAVAITAVGFDDPGGFHITSITRTGSLVSLSWTGGTLPYQVQKQIGINGQWTNQGNATIATSRTFASLDQNAFFRVRQSVPLLFITRDAQGAHLSWSVPDLE